MRRRTEQNPLAPFNPGVDWEDVPGAYVDVEGASLAIFNVSFVDKPSDIRFVSSIKVDGAIQSGGDPRQRRDTYGPDVVLESHNNTDFTAGAYVFAVGAVGSRVRLQARAGADLGGVTAAGVTACAGLSDAAIEMITDAASVVASQVGIGDYAEIVSGPESGDVAPVGFRVVDAATGSAQIGKGEYEFFAVLQDASTGAIFDVTDFALSATIGAVVELDGLTNLAMYSVQTDVDGVFAGEVTDVTGAAGAEVKLTFVLADGASLCFAGGPVLADIAFDGV